MRLASLTMSPLLQTIGSGSHGLRKLLSHHAASHLHAFPTLSLLPRMPFSCFSLANSSFETRLRGPLQDALPAPSRLGKMPPVCIFITELINSSHVLCHGLIHVCPAPPRPAPNGLCFSRGRVSSSVFYILAPCLPLRMCGCLKCFLSEWVGERP